MISFQCTACGKRLKVEDKHAGRKGKCPECKTRLKVPSETPEQEQASTKTIDPEVLVPSSEKPDGIPTALSTERGLEPPVPEEPPGEPISNPDPIQQTEATSEEQASTPTTNNEIGESSSETPKEVQPAPVAKDEPEPSAPRHQPAEILSKSAPTAPVSQPDSASEVLDHSGATSCYTNYIRINMNPEEVILESGFNPQAVGASSGTIRLRQRLVMSPYTAKRFLAALSAAVQRHERAFGALEIDVLKRRHAGPVGR